MLKTIPLTGEYHYLTFIGEVDEKGDIVPKSRGCVVDSKPINKEDFAIISMSGTFEGPIDAFKFEGVFNFYRNQIKYKFTGKCKYFALLEGTLECDGEYKYTIANHDVTEVHCGPIKITFLGKDLYNYYSYIENFAACMKGQNGTISSKDITGTFDGNGIKVTWLKNKYLYEGKCTFTNSKKLIPAETGTLTNLESGQKVSGKLLDHISNDYSEMMKEFMKE